MKRSDLLKKYNLLALGAVSVLSLSACGKQEESTGIKPQNMSDAIYMVLQADRAVYTKLVVNRLQNEEKVIKATEHWQEDKTLPLPAQMFRAASEMVQEKNAQFSYALLSSWPINTQNAARTEAEKTGLKYVLDNKGKNYYGEEKLGGKRYFTAVYPDIAISESCVECHNEHPDTPKTDFKLGDVMGGVVIRIPLDS